MNEKNNKSQVDLFDFFEDENPQTDQEQTGTASEQEEDIDILDFNTEEDSNIPTTSDEKSLPQEQSQPEAIPISTVGLPIFEYAGVSEPIKNLQITFESLRKEKSKDFPELEKPEKVSWTMDYGIFKSISDTSITIVQVKSEIEASKEFLDALKKSKKPVICRVKPRVSGQTKGVVSAYKGVYTSLDAAAKEKKPISIIPSRDGKVYELRNNEIGLFVTPSHDIDELDPIVSCFRMKLPKIPAYLLQQAISFFRCFIKKDCVTEAMVHLLWDRQEKCYLLHVPYQTVSKSSVKSSTTGMDDKRYLHVADIHSHNTMSARFSSTDNEDEKATRIYMVIGRLDRYFPEISIRISNGGKYLVVNPFDVLEEPITSFPNEWLSRVAVIKKDSRLISSDVMESDAA